MKIRISNKKKGVSIELSGISLEKAKRIQSSMLGIDDIDIKGLGLCILGMELVDNKMKKANLKYLTDKYKN